MLGLFAADGEAFFKVQEAAGAGGVSGCFRRRAFGEDRQQGLPLGFGAGGFEGQEGCEHQILPPRAQGGGEAVEAAGAVHLWCGEVGAERLHHL